jgi:uncharacterized protein
MAPGRFLGVSCHPDADLQCQKALERLDAALRAHLTARLAPSHTKGGASDPAHDLLHLERVVATAKRIAAAEGADMRVVLPAAWLHDYVVVPKDDPRRTQASRLAAVEACAYLKEIGYAAALADASLMDAIAHAIEAHSFSANIAPQTLEAKVVQDADRLDGIGAIGIARCFACSGTMNRPFYSATDPFCTTREPDDALFTIDHFYAKLFKTAASMQTAAGKQEAEKRVEVMRRYLKELGEEI